MQNLLSSEKRTLDHWALSPASVHSLWSLLKFLNRFCLTILIRLRFLSVGHSESPSDERRIGIVARRTYHLRGVTKREPMDIGMRSLQIQLPLITGVSIRGSRCTALIILSLRSRAVVVSLLLFLTLREAYEWGALRHSSGGSRSHGEHGPWRQSHRSVRWPAPLRASALKEQNFSKRVHGWSRLFKDVLITRAFLGCGRSLAPQDGHDHCLTCLGVQHAEEAFVDGFMFFLWGHDHLGVAQ